MTWTGPLKKIDDFRFEIPSTYQGVNKNLTMKTSGVIYASEQMITQIRKDNAPEQTANMTVLPGIVGKAFAMPDIHWGYGFPIGGVAATDADEGVISPGGVGFDINCGVRLIRTNLFKKDLNQALIQSLIDQMFINVPSGLGSKAKVRLRQGELEDVAAEGARWAVKHGYGWTKDVDFLEERGCLKFADVSQVSVKAKQRGAPQLGSLGAGNHFLEIQYVDEIFNPDVAKVYGINNIGQICVMIHTGSRGFGHQICTDHLQILEKAVQKYHINLPDKQLACAPVNSLEGQNYFKAMACAANFAWCNRQMIVHWVRESFEKILRTTAEELGMDIIYDVCHNIAKLEEHAVEGKKRKVYVHRKGATRAFGPGSIDLPSKYENVGQPVIIPGDMGSESYLLQGTMQSEETFGSTCHGAGRMMSRNEAIHRFRGDEIVRQLGQRGIYVHPASLRVAAEEAPGSYKNVSMVVDAVHGAGISKKVVRLKPLGVVKG